MNPEELKKLNAFIRQHSKPEMTKQCLDKNLSVKGTKHDMAVRLLGIQLRDAITVENASRPVIMIRRNPRGRYVHDSTHLVFDKLSRKVIGREGKHGEVHDLKRQDIQLCRQYKFHYTLPECLDDPPFPMHKQDPLPSEDDNDDDDVSEEEEDDE